MSNQLASMLTNGNYRYDKKKTCKHRDCKYHTKPISGQYPNGKCRYMEKTGHSRIAQLPEGEARWPINCPFYAKKEKGKKAEA